MVIHIKGKMNIHQKVEESSKSIKLKNSSIKTIGAAGANVTLNQMEGGDEVREATMIAYTVTKPVTNVVAKGNMLLREKLKRDLANKIKRVDVAKNVSKKSVKKVAKDTSKATVKKVAKETAKTVAKETAKATAKVATATATTAAGTALAPGAGTLIGIGAGYAAGVEIERRDMKASNRNRKIKYFMDKMNVEKEQKDTLARLVKDLVMNKVKLWVKTAAPIIGLVALIGILAVVSAVAPIIATIATLYNSPFAILLPPLEAGDTVISVTNEYIDDFNQEVNTIAHEHIGCDRGTVDRDSTSNTKDIIYVYMVKYGVGDTATIMNDRAKSRLADVVDDMCYYYRNIRWETIEVDGEPYTESTLHVQVYLKNYRDMIDEYDFNESQIEMLEELMSQ